MIQPIEIKLPWPAKALHSNSRAHWADKHRATSKARQAAALVAKGNRVGRWPEATIMIELYPPSLRGDPSNLPIACKAYIDGIADAMRCDDRAFKVDYPRVFAGTRKGGEVVFRVYET
jgi:hypothetical protein